MAAVNDTDPNKPAGNYFANNSPVGSAGQPCTNDDLKAAVMRRSESNNKDN